MDTTQKLTAEILRQKVGSVYLYESLVKFGQEHKYITETYVNPTHEVSNTLYGFIVSNASELNLGLEALVEVWNYAKELEALAKNLTPPTK